MAILKLLYFMEYEEGLMGRFETVGEEGGVPVNVFINSSPKRPSEGMWEADLCGVSDRVDIFHSEEEFEAAEKELPIGSRSMIPIGTFPSRGEDGREEESPHILFAGKVLEVSGNPHPAEDEPNYCLHIDSYGFDFMLYTVYDGKIEEGDIASGKAFVYADLHGEEEGAFIPEADYRAEDSYMEMAIEEARFGIYNNHGGPFGAVVVKDGRVVGRGHNRVIADVDSTAHGEISAIRNAEKNLGTYDLSGAELYTTGEPCAMCLAACMWANIKKIYYGCTIEDNAIIGFRDEVMDSLFSGRDLSGDYLEERDREACLKLFEEYLGLDRDRY